MYRVSLSWEVGVNEVDEGTASSLAISGLEGPLAERRIIQLHEPAHAHLRRLLLHEDFVISQVVLLSLACFHNLFVLGKIL